MVYFVGAGSGAADLITVRGDQLLRRADVIVYAGSLVNPELLTVKKEGCAVYNSAEMTLEEVLAVMLEAQSSNKITVRLHTGDPSLYGAVREQMDALAEEGVPFECVPGVSSFLGAAAAMGAEYTLPGISQTVILTRMAGRTAVPEKESIAALAAHGCSMVVFLSAGMMAQLQAELIAGGYAPHAPAAIVYKATWPDEKIIRCTVETLAECADKEGINKTALVMAGDFLTGAYTRSRLYDPAFTTGFRKGVGPDAR
jgi:precorrin-4/cobalt-precorrin-4 C11-methyltransferase